MATKTLAQIGADARSAIVDDVRCELNGIYGFADARLHVWVELDSLAEKGLAPEAVAAEFAWLMNAAYYAGGRLADLARVHSGELAGGPQCDVCANAEPGGWPGVMA